jgi:hypothetical protein
MLRTLTLLALVLVLSLQACATRLPALCETDSDCMRFCDPADLVCDGGPQSESPKAFPIPAVN